MNYKSYIIDYHNSNMVEADCSSKDKKKDVSMVNVAMKIPMKSGYWSKKPGKKAVFVSPPA